MDMISFRAPGVLLKPWYSGRIGSLLGMLYSNDVGQAGKFFSDKTVP
jgi:hypothetical protein